MMKVLSLCTLLSLVLFGCASAPPPAVVDATQPATRFENGGPVYSLAWSSDGRIASAVRAGVKVWNPQESTVTTLVGHRGYVWGVAWSPDQRFVASGGWDGMVNVWNVQTTELVKSFTVDRLAFWCVTWSPDGSKVAAGADNGNVKVYTLATGEEKSFTTGGTSMIVSVAWSPKGDSLVTGDAEGNLNLWSTDKWELVRTFTIETDRMRYDINGAVWSPNGRWFATAHQDGWVRVWEPGRETAVASFQQQRGWLRGISWAADNRTLAAGGEDGTVSVWDFPTKTIRLTTPKSALGAWSVGLSPDAFQLAAGTGKYNDGEYGGVQVWTSPRPASE